MTTEERRAKNREHQRRYRERQKALGENLAPLTEKQKEYHREYMRKKREKARINGIQLPTDTWFSRNAEQHRVRTRKWRVENLERSREINREMQARRRSTPWGKINNCMWPIVHGCVGRNSSRSSKYTSALGYLWCELRLHLESQFEAEMTWENWGSVWELDHIKPLRLFQYTSLHDPLFKEAWTLSNLRPLWREMNLAKGSNP